MSGEPTDMFEEMDAMVARLFSRMDREFMAGSSRVFGYHIVIGSGDVTGGTAEVLSPLPRTTREPVAEVHRIGDETKVITELPGVSGESIRLDVKGSTLTIDAGDAQNHFHTVAEIPDVDAASRTQSFRHGVLEVTFSNLPAHKGEKDPGA